MLKHIRTARYGILNNCWYGIRAPSYCLPIPIIVHDIALRSLEEYSYTKATFHVNTESTAQRSPNMFLLTLLFFVISLCDAIEQSNQQITTLISRKSTASRATRTLTPLSVFNQSTSRAHTTSTPILSAAPSNGFDKSLVRFPKNNRPHCEHTTKAYPVRQKLRDSERLTD